MSGEIRGIAAGECLFGKPLDQLSGGSKVPRPKGGKGPIGVVVIKVPYHDTVCAWWDVNGEDGVKAWLGVVG